MQEFIKRTYYSSKLICISLLEGKRIFIFLLLMFVSFHSWSQTVVKLMTDQPEALSLNIDSSLYVGDVTEYMLGNNQLINGGTAPYSIEWTKGVELISTDTAFLIDVVNNEQYDLWVSDFRACTANKIITISNVNGLENTKEKIIIYPNPATYELAIKNLDEQIKYTGKLYNPSGKVVWNGEMIEDLSIPLNLPPGCYILKLRNGKNVITKKVLIL